MPLRERASISIVISVYNGGNEFRSSLESLARVRTEFDELIVVDDGSTDEAVRFASESGARILTLPSRRGPAHGRNVGALAATGDIILFLDSDVCVGPGTISQIARRFEGDPQLGAVFGSYDNQPGASGAVSLFRNLLHHYVHQTSNRSASTFWAGCGAIRRTVFCENSGFDAAYATSCVEDIELGIRLTRARVRIALDPSIQVKHMKRWTLLNMIASDTWYRAVPWTILILQSQQIPNDLNLRLSTRASVAATAAICLELAFLAVRVLQHQSNPLTMGLALLLIFELAAVAILNLPFYRVVAGRRQIGLSLLALPLHLVHFLCCGIGFALGVTIHYSRVPVWKAGRIQPPLPETED